MQHLTTAISHLIGTQRAQVGLAVAANGLQEPPLRGDRYAERRRALIQFALMPSLAPVLLALLLWTAPTRAEVEWTDSLEAGRCD